MVIRMHEQLPPDEVSKLNEDFSDILTSGKFRAGKALREEAGEEAIADLPRLIFKVKRGKAGRIRQLLDHINTFGSPQS